MSPKRLIRIGLLAWAVAWFLPVVEDGATFPDMLPGWEALRVALSPVWPYGDFESGSWVEGLLSVLSGLTNLLVLGAMTRASQSEERRVRRMAVALTGAAVVNAHWFVLSGERSALEVGYYLWWLAFVLLAVGFRRLSKPTPTPVPPPPAS